MNLTVACVLSRVGNKGYDRSHVERLREQVAANLNQPYVFACLDNSPYPGWWSKISLFEPGRFTGKVLFFDLDVTIVGGLDEVANYPTLFAGARDPLNSSINSSVMLFEAGTHDHIYTQFRPDVMQRLHGDQDWIRDVSLPSKFPIDWFPSFKYDLRRDLNNLNKNAKAILYHGLPKPFPWPVKDKSGSEPENASM